MTVTRQLVALALAWIVLAPQPAPITFPPRSGSVIVVPVRAVDGDTVEFYWCVEGVARLPRIDAPEMHGADRRAGEAARDYLTSVLPTGPTPALVRGRDKYGRTLLEVQGKDGKWLSDVMLESGHVRPWPR